MNLATDWIFPGDGRSGGLKRAWLCAAWHATRTKLIGKGRRYKTMCEKGKLISAFLDGSVNAKRYAGRNQRRALGRM